MNSKPPFNLLSTKSLLSLWLVLLFFVLNIASAEAQKKNRKNKSKKANTSSKVLSDEKKTKAEHYFIEAEKYFMLRDKARAYDIFLKVLEIQPDNAAANFKVAQILQENKENNKALQYALKAKNKDVKNKYYHLLLANIYTNLAQLDNAIAVYSEMLDHVTGAEQYLFDLGALQFYQKQYDASLISYEKAKAHYGMMEQITYQKQKIYLKQNKLDMAIAEGKELIAFDPSEEAYTLSLAQILMSNDKLDECQQLLETYINNHGERDRISVFVAELYRKSGAPYKALQALKPVFRSNSTNAIAKGRTLAGYLAMLPNKNLESGLIELAEILVEKHPDSFESFALVGDMYFTLGKKIKAKENYAKAIDLDASNYNIWQNILSLDMDLQQYDDAIKHAALALEVFPNQAALYYYGGSAYLIKKKYTEAIKVLNVGKFYANSDANLKSIFFGQLGDAYNGQSNYEKSDAAYDEALKSKPDNDHVLNNYSYFLSLREEHLEKALDMSSQLVKRYPDNPTYLDTHGWVLYIMEDYVEAKKYLEKALEDDPSSTIIEHYGDVLFQLGEVDEAILQWKKAREGAEDKERLDKKIANKQVYE